MKKFSYSFPTLLFLVFFSLISCSKDDNKGVRIGAECNDGTFTRDTDDNACSEHGGVTYWYYGDESFSYEDEDDDCTHIGAICEDGTISSATGSGACSHHGGVSSWLCSGN
jgi:hypothetical protein